MKMPKVSIGLPVYNGAKYLRESLDSILGQSFTDFELIISDNASTDGSGELCERYAETDRRIRFYRNENNLGAVSNFNRVFELAVGRYFKWISCDDIHASQCLERCVKVLDERPDVVLCYPKTTIIDHMGETVRYHEDGLDLRSSSPHRRLRQLLSKPAGCNPIFGLMRADVLRGTRLFRPYEATDHNLLAEMCLRGKFYEAPERLFYRRDHANMYRRSSRTNRDFACWLDTAYHGRNLFPVLRVLTELIKAVQCSPVSGYEKVLCYGEILGRSVVLTSRAVHWIRARSDPESMY
jgi:glycosyltransferase involved in cell wall biosynthesis